MSDRKLASIMTVKELTDIEGKDKICYVTFNEASWQVIGSKSLTVGEKVLYLEYDSVIPETMLSKMDEEFVVILKKRCWSVKLNGCLIRAMKMAGKVSYGILFQYDEIKNLISEKDWNSYAHGKDLTEILGIFKRDDDSTAVTVKVKDNFLKKYWKIFLLKCFKIKKKSSCLGQWVPFIAKTDEIRIQAMPRDTVESLQGVKVYITEKIDGQSATYAIFKKKFYICSRNQCLYIKPLKKAVVELNPSVTHKQTDRFIATACKYDIANRLFEVRTGRLGTSDLAIQGEQAGPGIQGNPLMLKDIELFVFNVYDITHKYYLSIGDIEWFVKQMSECGHNQLSGTPAMQTVPVLDPNCTFNFQNVEELEKRAKDKTFNGKGKHREGIVIRTITVKSPSLAQSPDLTENSLSFKVINPDYILNKKEEE